MFNFTVKSSTISWQKCVIAILSLFGAGRAGRDVYARLSIEDSAAYTPLIVTAAHSTLTHCTVSGWVGPCLDASKDLKTDCTGLSRCARCGSEGRAEGKRTTGKRRDGRGRSMWMGHGKLALSGRCEGVGSDELGQGGLLACLFCYV